MQQLSRRNFLKATFMAAGAASVPARSWGQVAGANEEIGVAVIGFNGQGGSHINSLMGLRKGGEKVRIVALCDADRDVLDKRARQLSDAQNPVESFTDIRRLLERKEIDAVSIATPNHWHSLMAIWAVQAGKDVYVEKPVSHNVWEGRQVVAAARKYQKIVQTGTQIRSSHGIREAVKWVQEGNLGKILVSRGLCYKRRGSIGKVTGPQPVPASVDYNLWCGPAAQKPLMRSRLHYDWHWVWETGNGDLGNQGIHQMDIARWFLGVDRLSPRVCSVGGRLGYVDDGETPNTQFVFHDYENAPLIFEVRGLPQKAGAKDMDKYMGAGVGCVIHCENGYVAVPSYTSAIAFDKTGKEIRRFEGSTNHHGNFLKAVRSRKYTDLNADILEGHLSSALCHTGNISLRLGKALPPEDIREVVKGEKEALATFERMCAHLGLNEVDLNKTPLTLGMALTMNPQTEQFEGNPDANALLTRSYRAPFVVPEKV